MNIQARKLHLIEEFLHITDESVISKLELFIKLETKNAKNNDVKPMSLNEFYEMIDQSKRDIDEGRIISHTDLKKKIKTWV